MGGTSEQVIEDFGGELDIDRAVALLRGLPIYAPWFIGRELELGPWMFTRGKNGDDLGNKARRENKPRAKAKTETQQEAAQRGSVAATGETTTLAG